MPMYWVDQSPPSDPTPPFNSTQIMATLTSILEPSQRDRVKQVFSDADLAFSCPQAFNGLSTCFGAIQFNRIVPISSSTASVNYTLRFDPGLNKVKVNDNSGDVEKRVLPLQWALDSAIIQLNGGPSVTSLQEQGAIPSERPFTESTNEEQSENQRRSLLRGVDTLVVLAFFVGLLGVVWHMPSSVSEERGMGMTSLLTTMGCSQSSRLASWISGPGFAYLPAYFVMGGVISKTLWTNTNVALCIFSHVISGLSMACWSLFLATFFSRANISSVVTTAIAILAAIVALLTKDLGEGPQVIIGLLFPPASFVYMFISISRFEAEGLPAKITATAPGKDGGTALGQLLAEVVAIFLFPFLTAALERKLFYTEPFLTWIFRRNKKTAEEGVDGADIPASSGLALEIRNLVKRYGRSTDSIAVDGLYMKVEKGSITCLLGSNGSGKSTTIGVISGTIGKTSGEVRIQGKDRNLLPPGTLGLCPQKNVLFPELDCKQHVQVFRAVKDRRMVEKAKSARANEAELEKEEKEEEEEEEERLLKGCELGSKLKSKPGQLSGGQKRRLQTAMALVGGSTFLMFDEATSGLDPISRRAIWKIILAQRGEKTVLLTSHFLDEADLLGDSIVILAAPGKKLCEGSPIEIKERFGEGSYIHVSPVDTAESGDSTLRTRASFVAETEELIGRHVGSFERIRESSSTGEIGFLIPRQSGKEIREILFDLEENKERVGISSYDVAGPTLESVFLKLNSQHALEREKAKRLSASNDHTEASGNSNWEKVEAAGDKEEEEYSLTDGNVASWWYLTWAQVVKRFYILKRSWLPPLFAIALAIIGNAVPLLFLKDRNPSCGRGFTDIEISLNAFAPERADFTPVLFSPLGELENYLGQGFPLDASRVEQLSPTDFQTRIETDYRNLTFGGIDLPQGFGASSGSGGASSAAAPRLAYLADSTMDVPISALNLVSNAALSSVRTRETGSTSTTGTEGPIIYPSLRYLSNLSLGSGLGGVLKWAVIFGLVQAVVPAFSALYPSAERTNLSKSLALSNGMRPLPLWLGHLISELPVILLSSVPIALIYGVGTDQFQGTAYFWLTLFLYGLSSSIQSFCVTLIAPNRLAAFAIVAAWNVLAFLIYFASTLLTVTYYVGSDLKGVLDTVFWIEALLSPSVSMTRSGFLTSNLFSLLCDGRGGYSENSLGSLPKFGGPVLYLILWGVICFSILIWTDSGKASPFGNLRLAFWKRREVGGVEGDEESKIRTQGPGVADEVLRLESQQGEDGSKDALITSHLYKSYGSLLAVDDFTLGVGREETVALLGINGGGKTTVHSMIKGQIKPDAGKVVISGREVDKERKLAISKLSSVPQFDGLEPTLTVREHIQIYNRIKGIGRAERKSNVEKVLRMTRLEEYSDRLSRDLSGGNMRKLSLAIALIGNPEVLLLDELSSGVDAWNKRRLWDIMKKVGKGRATLMTTHSMEESDALADRVVIQSGRILAIGTIKELRRLKPCYELQLDIGGGGGDGVPGPSPPSPSSSSSYSSSSSEAGSVRGVNAAVNKARMEKIQSFVKSLFPDSVASDEASSRFEIPLGGEGTAKVCDIFSRLEAAEAERASVGVKGYQISPVSLESLFLHIVRRELEEKAR
ncbi:hypothetical protein IE53DRAFT_390183 [Violaceomyces palustris]|uniref:Uncharacterized protein n=1 Tax=Violaceomyces palustris TaxID=1673888 RepID=A0ACD0NPB8_9BASI|nr:hypothetical protein IE53DRAFT_390183 [Violaceomyces palustris]